MAMPLVYNESATGQLVLKPSRPIKNVYLICSHQHFVGFQSRKVENITLDF